MAAASEINSFLDYLRHERNYSELTVEQYGKDLESFLAYLTATDTAAGLLSADTDMVRGWMEVMMEKGNKASSVSRRLSSLRTFYKYAMMAGLVEHNPAHSVRAPKKGHPLPQFVREAEMDELLGEEMWSDTFKDVRARTLLLVFYSTGMRLSELISLDDNMVDFVSREIRVTGKRNKQRIIPFGDELSAALQSYITRRDDEVPRQSSALFVTAGGERMNRNKVRYEVVKWLTKVTTLRKRTPHVLRHTFATAMLNHDAGLESVKKLLGHESLTTTEIYTHATFEQLKRVYNSAHPRA
jgi:integrase/recombinase XerC